MGQNERHTLTFRKEYGDAIEQQVCAKEGLLFSGWVRKIIRLELCRIGVAIVEPRPGSKPQRRELPGQAELPPLQLEQVAPARKKVKRKMDQAHKANLEGLDAEPVPAAEGGVASIIDDPPFVEAAPPLADTDDGLDLHDREIEEEMQRGHADPEPF